jgi:phospholipase C
MRNVVPALLLVAAAAGCANTSGNTAAACQPLKVKRAARAKSFGGTVFTIVMENHSYADIIGNTLQAPFINQLASQSAVARGYHDSYVHPSEPNYIWLVAGENFGILNDNDPGAGNHITSKSHLVDQIEAAGLTWKAYQESMGAACGVVSHGEYAAKHDPFVYFDDVAGFDGTAMAGSPRCSEHVVDYSELEADVAAGQLPDYAFITPNLIDDMHDGSVADGDAWLAREVPKILGAAAFDAGGVLFLLWDEGGGLPAGDDPPFIAISPHARRGFVSTTPYDSSSYLKTVQTILGLDILPCAPNAATVPAMSDLFTVPL